MKRLSGLQKDVLSLYRIILRVAFQKDSHDKSSFIQQLCYNPNTSTYYARNEFRKQAQKVQRSDFQTIEYQIRKGHKQIKMLRQPGVKSFGGGR